MKSTRLAFVAAFVLAVAVPLSAATERYVLFLDGANAGEILNFRGGSVSADVIDEAVGPTHFIKKHIGAPKYEDMVFSVAALPAQGPLTNWIGAALSANYMRKSGSIVVIDNQGNAVRAIEFFNALITGIELTPADSSSNAPAAATLHVAPEYIRALKAAGRASIPQDSVPARQSSFQFIVGNFAAVTRGELSPVGAAQVVTEDPIGDQRDYLREPGRLSFANLSLTLDVADADPFIQWHEDFVIKGNCSEDKEKTATLAFLSSSGRETPLAVKFYNMGIFGLRPAANGKVQVDLYVERFELLQP